MLRNATSNRRICTLWCSEVNDISIFLEHVDLLNALKWLETIDLFQSNLKLLVIGAAVSWLGLDVSSWNSLSSAINSQLQNSMEIGRSNAIEYFDRVLIFSHSRYVECRMSCRVRGDKTYPTILYISESSPNSFVHTNSFFARKHSKAHSLEPAGAEFCILLSFSKSMFTVFEDSCMEGFGG